MGISGWQGLFGELFQFFDQAVKYPPQRSLSILFTTCLFKIEIHFLRQFKVQLAEAAHIMGG